MQKIYTLSLSLLFLFSIKGNTQNIEVLLDTVSNCANNTYSVTIQVRAASGSSSFELGTSSVFLTYNSDALQYQSYTSTLMNGTGACASAWDVQKVDSGSEAGSFHLSLSLLDNTSSCPTIDDISLTPIGMVVFSVVQQGGSPDLRIDVANTHFNNDIPNNGSSVLAVTAVDSVVSVGVLACDCAGAGQACNDGNIYTIRDKYDIYCACKGEYVDEDGDNIWDGVDPCIDKIYEAENALLQGTTFSNYYAGHTGIGYEDFGSDPGSFIEFAVDIDSTGDHQMGFRYALYSGNRPMELKIDGALTQASVSFLATGAWDIWDTVIIVQNFTPGAHTVRLTTIGSGANFDHLLVSFCTSCTTTGQSCDDGLSCTTNDVYGTECNCGGLLEDDDNDGVCNTLDICAGGDDTLDADMDGIPDFCDTCNNALIGIACDDGDPCTTGDVYDANCACVGVFVGPDSDNDGVCDTYDVCAGGDDKLDADADGIPDFCDTCDNRLIGTPCTDNNPCTVLDAYVSGCSCFGIPLPLGVNETVTNLVCNGDNMGSIGVDVSGTMGPVAFAWSNGANTATIANLPPGNYSLTITDVRGCSLTESYTVQEPPAFSASQAITYSTGTNGAVNVTPSGGVTPYAFHWNLGQTTEDLTNLIPSTYWLTTTDAWGCSKTLKADVFPANMCIDSVYQGENATYIATARARTGDSTAIGHGYGDFRGDTLDAIQFTVHIPQSGLYSLVFRHSHPSNKAHEISVDGKVKFPSLLLPKTTSYQIWTNTAVNQAFLAGTHTVTIRNTSLWGANIDFMSVCLVEPAKYVSPKIFIEAPDANGRMSDNLRSQNLIPLSEPYQSQFTLVGCGGEKMPANVLNNTGDNAIIDWIFLELRDKNDSLHVLETRSALLQRDGDVVDMDGVSPVAFPGASTNSYYIAVRHRNRLGIMTANPIALASGITPLNFTDTSIPLWGANALRNLGNGTYAMWAGNGNGDKKIVYQGSGSDLTPITATVYTNPLNVNFEASFPTALGYYKADFNMDGKVIYQGSGSDLTPITASVYSNPLNINFEASFPVLEQLPD